MAAVPGPNVMALKLQCAVQGNLLSNTFHYSSGSAYNYAQMHGVGDEFEANVLPALQAIVSEDVHFQSVQVHGVEPNEKVPYIHWLEDTPGLVTEESLPTNIAGVVQLRQLETSGKHNGRMMIAGLCESQTIDSLLDPTFIAGDMATFCTALLAPLVVSGTNFNLHVLERYLVMGVKTRRGWKVSQCRPMRNLATQRKRRVELRSFHA